MEHPQLVFITGKGGVGKTTVTRALGQISQKEGRKTAVIEMNGEQQLSQLFGFNERRFGPVSIMEGLDLFSLDALDCLQNFGETKLRSKHLVKMLLGHRVFDTLIDGVPGFHDLFQLGKINHLLTDNGKDTPYEQIYVDTPSTGHALSLFSAAASIRDMTRVGLIHEEAKRIAQTLANPSITASVVVTFPERLPLQETISFVSHLDSEHPSVGGIVVNRWILGHPLKRAEHEATKQAILATGSSELDSVFSHWQHTLREQQHHVEMLTQSVPKTIPIYTMGELSSEQTSPSLIPVTT